MALLPDLSLMEGLLAVGGVVLVGGAPRQPAPGRAGP